jgi:hypothetical protein
MMIEEPVKGAAKNPDLSAGVWGGLFCEGLIPDK